jgi:hypothetical protein
MNACIAASGRASGVRDTGQGALPSNSARVSARSRNELDIYTSLTRSNDVRIRAVISQRGGEEAPQERADSGCGGPCGRQRPLKTLRRRDSVHHRIIGGIIPVVHFGDILLRRRALRRTLGSHGGIPRRRRRVILRLALRGIILRDRLRLILGLGPLRRVISGSLSMNHGRETA